LSFELRLREPGVLTHCKGELPFSLIGSGKQCALG